MRPNYSPYATPKLSFAALLFLSTALSAQTPAADTTIAGQTLPLLPIETLIAQLQRPANGPAVVHRQVAFRGRLFAPTSGLDTLRVPLDLEEVYFLDEVSFSQVAFLAPVRFERAHFAGGLSFAEARFTAAFALRASHLAKHATFQKTHFLGDADLTASRFAGVASFVGARFAGQRAPLRPDPIRQRRLFRAGRLCRASHFHRRCLRRNRLLQGNHLGAAPILRWSPLRRPGAVLGRALRRGSVLRQRTCRRRSRLRPSAVQRRGILCRFHLRAGGALPQCDLWPSPALMELISAKRPTSATARAASSASGAFFNRSLDLSRAAFALIDLRSAEADSTFAANSHLYLHQPRFGRIQVR